ncbi:GntR family transcriptional regulator [Amycolatopsis sp. YIM 10]|uniref:GntR family transcriptional regulator n=1 Tax=Amycolatopsis sp. YIM 10 TaxID=2653857 RepID=UPI001290569E|nr:GntR family transcriptional regulator [Amycolatopsis sp. YIM 10]QFU89862.1 HTH-type transcriptional regulator McbR [Amycolatopsis sp. YIM 10]
MTSGNAGSPPQSRTAWVADRIREDVAAGTIRPGELIKQTVLAKRYGVSPTPVREALRILEADGMIVYSAHKGATVREMTPDTAADLYRLRAAVESAAAGMAVERMTAEGLAEIEARHSAIDEAMRAGAPPAELSRLNKDFHFAIYAQSSPLVQQYVEALWVRFTPPATIWSVAHAGVLQRDHDEILAAVRRGDAEAASRLTAEHVRHAAAIRDAHPELRASGPEDREDLSGI